MTARASWAALGGGGACLSLSSCQQCMSVPIAPHPHQHLILSDF